MARAFKTLDLNGDGKLSRDELITGYRQTMGDLAEAEVDRILAIADADGSGEIDYSEWIIASVNKKKLLT